METHYFGYSGKTWRIAGLVLLAGLAYMGYRAAYPPTIARFQGVAINKMCDWQFKMKSLEARAKILTMGVSSEAAFIINTDLIEEFTTSFRGDTGQDYFLIQPIWLDYVTTNGNPC